MPANRFNFTKAVIETIQVTDKKIRYHDTKVRGLVLVVRPGGSKGFYLYRKIDRKPVEVKIGPWPDVSIEYARNRATELNAAIARGMVPRRDRTLPSALVTDPRGVETLEDWDSLVGRTVALVRAPTGDARQGVMLQFTDGACFTIETSVSARRHSS